MSWQSRIEKVIANKAFEFFIIFIIMASALTVGVKTYDITPFWLSVLEVADIGRELILRTRLEVSHVARAPLRDDQALVEIRDHNALIALEHRAVSNLV